MHPPFQRANAPSLPPSSVSGGACALARRSAAFAATAARAFRELEFLNRFHQPTHCGNGVSFQNLQVVNELHYIQLPLSGFDFGNR